MNSFLYDNEKVTLGRFNIFKRKDNSLSFKKKLSKMMINAKFSLIEMKININKLKFKVFYRIKLNA
jgi:hypothetical protein